MNLKLSKLEKQWILYDVGNSAFILLAATVIPIVFNSLASKSLTESQYFAYWGYAVTISTVVVGILGPILGALSDRKNVKKRLYMGSVIIGVIGCAIMPIFSNWLVFLIVYILTKIGYNASQIFYDSMLPDITSEDRMDIVSSHGYAWGYIGSVIPFIISILLLFNAKKIGISTSLSVLLAFLINAIWWFVMALPLYKNYKQIYFNDREEKVSQIFGHLVDTFKDVLNNKKILYFLLSFFFFIDGVYTIINMATAYGTSLGLSSQGLIMALLVTQIVAFPCALFFSKISKKYPTESLIKICIGAYFLITLYAIQLDKLYEFWVLAILVGAFQGAIQALSRSYYAKIIPSNKSGEYFGIFDICGKGASIIGTFLISVIAQITGNQQLAVGTLAILFLCGYLIFNLSTKVKQ